MKKTITLLLIFIALSIFGQVPSYVPTNGLLAWWPFTGNANDLSSNGYNGTVNGATLTTDRFGSMNHAYNFVNNSISIPGNINFTRNPITYSFWFVKTATGNLCQSNEMFQVVFSTGSYGQSREVTVSPDNSIGIQRSISTGCNNFFGVSNNIVNNNWYHAVIIYESNLVKIYLDGVLISSLPVTCTTNTSTTLSYIGASTPGIWACASNFKGKLDDIGIWNRALTQQEITNLYNASLSTEDFAINTINIYPNPTTSLLNFKSAIQVEKILIYNMLGQLVQEEKVNALEGSINIENLAQGTYIVKVNNVAKGYTIIKN